jgi:toxin ParE1/3/4
MRHEIILHDKAREEIEHLYDYIADHAGPSMAWDYVGGLREFLEGLAEFPERGTVRDGPVSGLRVIGYRRRTSVAFVVDPGKVIILGIFHGGRLIDEKALLARL